MTNTKKVVFTLLGAVALSAIVMAIKAKKWYKDIKYGLGEGVKPIKVNFQIVQIYLPFWLYNPTPFNVIGSNMDIKVYIDGYYVSRITSQGNYQISAKSTSTYPMIVNIDPKTIIQLAADKGTIISDPNWMSKVIISLKGTITLDMGLFKIRNFPIDFTDPLKNYV